MGQRRERLVRFHHQHHHHHHRHYHHNAWFKPQMQVTNRQGRKRYPLSPICYNNVEVQPHSTVRGNETKRFGFDIVKTISTDHELPKKTSLLDLPIDIFLNLLHWLEILDVFSLRRVCKGLERATREHSTWAILAASHVIEANLPWPTWALPITKVPSRTLEELTLQAIRMKKHWDDGDSLTTRKFTRCIERPWESVTWLRILQSRWLVVQQFGASLELWDLEQPSYSRPSLVIESVVGIVDGTAISAWVGPSIMWMISTRSSQTLTIKLYLPPPSENAEIATARAEVVGSSQGFSRLVDADGHLAAFLSCAGEHGAFIRDMGATGSVCLDGTEERAQIRQVFSVQFNSTLIALSTASALELYSRSTTQCALTSACGNQITVQPIQRLPYPSNLLCGGLIVSATFLTASPTLLSSPHTGNDTFRLCILNGANRFLCIAQPQETTSETPGYRFSSSEGILFPDPFSPMFFRVGASGRRLVFVAEESRGLSLCGVTIPVDLSGSRSSTTMRKEWIGWWRITDQTSNDLVQHVEFDEATGTCALGMGSGRVWVANLTSAALLPRSYKGPLGCPPESSTPRADLFWSLNHPLPWPASYHNDEGRPNEIFRPSEWSMSTSIIPAEIDPTALGVPPGLPMRS